MITIKDFEMPEDCRSCPISSVIAYNYSICTVTGKQIGVPNKRHKGCPLQEGGCDICEFKHRCTRRPAGEAIIFNCEKFKKEENND